MPWFPVYNGATNKPAFALKLCSYMINASRTLARVKALVVLTILTLTVLVTTIDAQWEGMGDVGSARYELALLPPCPTIRVLSYSN